MQGWVVFFFFPPPGKAKGRGDGAGFQEPQKTSSMYPTTQRMHSCSPPSWAPRFEGFMASSLIPSPTQNIQPSRTRSIDRASSQCEVAITLDE